MYCCNKNRRRFQSVPFGQGCLKPLFEFTDICYAQSSVIFISVALVQDRQIFLWLFTIRRNCSCSSFFVSDILYCCIKAMALSAESFTTVMVDAAIRKSW